MMRHGCPYHGRHLMVSVCGVCEYVAIEWLKTGGTAETWYALSPVENSP